MSLPAKPAVAGLTTGQDLTLHSCTGGNTWTKRAEVTSTSYYLLVVNEPQLQNPWNWLPASLQFDRKAPLCGLEKSIAEESVPTCGSALSFTSARTSAASESERSSWKQPIPKALVVMAPVRGPTHRGCCPVVQMSSMDRRLHRAWCPICVHAKFQIFWILQEPCSKGSLTANLIPEQWLGLQISFSHIRCRIIFLTWRNAKWKLHFCMRLPLASLRLCRPCDVCVKYAKGCEFRSVFEST